MFFFSLLVFLAHTAVTQTAIFADGRFYFALTRSLVKDFDLNLINEYHTLGVEPLLNSRGLAINKYPPGVSLFWLPLFGVTDALIRTANLLLGADISTDGFSLPYQTAVAATSAGLGVLGLYLVYSFLQKFFSQRISFLTAFTLLLTTNLFFYIAVEPINSHAVSFFAASLFVFYFLKKWSPKMNSSDFLLGLIGGVAALVRTQDVLIMLLPAAAWSKRPQKIKRTVLLGLGFLTGFLPQIGLWKLFFNTFWKSPFLDEGFNFFRPQVLHVLLNPQNGLFLLTPVTLISLIGLFLFRKKNRQLFYLALAYFLLQLYLVSSWRGYAQGGSFSIRMLISTYPLLAFGLAAFLERAKTVLGWGKTAALVGVFSIINFGLIFAYLWFN